MVMLSRCRLLTALAAVTLALAAPVCLADDSDAQPEHSQWMAAFWINGEIVMECPLDLAGEMAGSMPTDIYLLDGYSFEGWSLSEDGEPVDPADVSSYTSDVNLYALYTPMGEGLPMPAEHIVVGGAVACAVVLIVLIWVTVRTERRLRRRLRNISILATAIFRRSENDLREYSSGRHSAAPSRSSRNILSASPARPSEHITAFSP